MENFDKVVAMFLELFEEISNNSKAKELISKSIKNMDKLAYHKKYDNKPLFIKELLSNFSDMNYDIGQFIRVLLTVNKILELEDKREEIGLIGIDMLKEIVSKDDSSGIFYKHYVMASIYFLIGYNQQCSKNLEILNEIVNKDLATDSKEALLMYWLISSIYEETTDYAKALEYLNISKTIEVENSYNLISKGMFLEKEYIFYKELGRLEEAIKLSIEMFKSKEKKELIDFERIILLSIEFGDYPIAIKYLEELLELEGISKEKKDINFKKLTNLYVRVESHKRTLDYDYMR